MPDFSPRELGHLFLDMIGFVPVVGIVADVTNAAFYEAEGNYFYASLSLVAAVPVAGSFLGNGAKWGGKAFTKSKIGTKLAGYNSKAVNIGKRIKSGIKKEASIIRAKLKNSIRNVESTRNAMLNSENRFKRFIAVIEDQ